MKKRIAMVLMCVIALTCLLTGCQLTTIDQDKYLNQVVARVGDDVEITLEELYVSYQNYAETLTGDDYKLSKEQALEYCLNLLIEREIALIKAKDTLTLTEKEKNDALDTAYDYIVTQINKYEEEIRKEKGIDAPKDFESEEESTEKDEVKTEKEYVAKANLVYDETTETYNIARNVVPESPEEEPAYGYVNGLIEGFKAYWVKAEDEISDLAYDRFVKDLKQYEENKNLSKINDEILEREIQRVLDLQIENAYVKKLETNYENTHLATKEQVYAKYNSLVTENKSRYDLEGVGFDAYVSDMLSTASTVYYHPVENQFYYVTHILLSFSEEQTKLVKEQDDLLDKGGVTQADRDAYVENLAKEISIIRKDANGVEVGSPILAGDIFAEIEQAMTGKSFNEKVEIFNSYIYQFNSDPGIMNAEFDYVIGVKNEEDEEGTDSRSKMVKEFNEDSRALIEQSVISNTFGQMSSQPVLTDYGYHIIFLSGAARNMIVSTNVDEAMLDLNNYKTSAHSKQTYFNNIYDAAIVSEYQTELKGYIEAFKSGKENVTYEKIYNLLKDRLG